MGSSEFSELELKIISQFIYISYDITAYLKALFVVLYITIKLPSHATIVTINSSEYAYTSFISRTNKKGMLS